MRVPWFPNHLHLDPIISALHWVACSPVLPLGSNGSCRFGSTGFWLSSSHMGGTEFVGIVIGQLWGICRQGTRGQGVSICLSVMSSPKKLARYVGSDGASPKSLAKSNWTSFCTEPKGRHSATGLSREQGYPVACIGALPIHIQLLDSSCWGWRWRSLKEWFKPLVYGVWVWRAWGWWGVPTRMCPSWQGISILLEPASMMRTPAPGMGAMTLRSGLSVHRTFP